MAEEKKEPVTIKKYANRRLYNTGTSTYVTLEDLAAMVKNGEDFIVYDAKTGEDPTQHVVRGNTAKHRAESVEGFSEFEGEDFRTRERDSIAGASQSVARFLNRLHVPRIQRQCRPAAA